MTRNKESRRPVSSFGPELLELLIQGAKGEVKVPCPSMRFMKNLQMRLHLLRGAMQREKHEQYNLVTRARTSCTWDFVKFPSTKHKQFPPEATDCVLVIQPNDAQFKDVLEAAGIKATTHTRDLLEDTPVPPSPANPTVEPTPDVNTDPYSRFK